MLERFGPVVGGLLVAGLLVVALPGSDSPAPGEPVTVPVTGAAAVDGFLGAWERSWRVEAVVESVTTRTLADGRELSYEQRLVQRPPDDRLVIGAGSASGRIGGRTVRCASVAEGPQCTTGDEAPPYDDEVADQVAAFEEMLEPGTGLYEVSTLPDGCFHLQLRLRMFTPPYGIESTFCFDDATGVLEEVEVVRPEATDRTVAVEVRTTVTAADLRAADLGDPIATG